MSTYLVSYDLRTPGRDYETLWAYLRTSSTHWNALGSVWLIVSTATAAQIRDRIAALVDAGDRVLVVRIDGAHWATKGMDAGTDWMFAHVAGR